jgi:leucyl aminopeptidase (aminopeptidase T)
MTDGQVDEGTGGLHQGPRVEDLTTAARMLVQTALRVAAGERFVIVGDLTTSAILTALELAGRDAQAEVAVLRLDQLRSYSTNHSGERPHKVLPDAIRRAMLSAQASVFVASAPRAEASMRDQLQHIVGACRIRHAHLPGITASAFATGLAVDQGAIAQLGSALGRLLEVGREITSESAEGTRLVVHPGARRWIGRFGNVEPGSSVVFPTGSFVVAPENVRGTFAATASLGEFFGARERLLRDPVLFDIRDGVVKAVRSAGSPELVRDVEAMLAVAPNSERVGCVVLGLNTGAPEPVGSVAVDQHRPGLHLILGDPQSRLTDAGWSARTSFAACQTSSSVSIDGVLVATGGRLLVELS